MKCLLRTKEQNAERIGERVLEAQDQVDQVDQVGGYIETLHRMDRIRTR
jgi:hypothetical protein